jgi:hypothetical protein
MAALSKTRNMKKIVFLAGIFILSASLMAQKKQVASTASKNAVQVVPLRPENWTARPGALEFTEQDGRSVMKVVARSGVAVAMGVDFTDGTIEFDEEPTDPSFASFYFRWQDSLESECFYFRTGRGDGHPEAMDAIQYAPIVKGINYWDLLPHYQTNASFQRQSWNHVKLVISGKQMRAYVNSRNVPTLAVSRLEGNTAHGAVAFNGQCSIANLVLRPGQVEGLSPEEGPDPTANDPRYLRHWQVTEPDSIPKPIDFAYDLMPGKATAWHPIEAARRGLIDLTRLYGGTLRRGRCIAWLKTTITSDKDKRYLMRLGFLDDIWVYINGRLLYVDKNNFGSPIAKDPDGRLSLDNTQLWLPLKQGENELLIGLVSDFYGWGITARLDDPEGLLFSRP